MACHARGNRYRNGLSPVDIVRKFPDDAVVAAWTFQQRWPEGVRCPRCDSDNVQSKGKHPSMSYRCQQCRKFFSYRMGTVMQGSNLGEQVWVIATDLLSTGIWVSRKRPRGTWPTAFGRPGTIELRHGARRSQARPFIPMSSQRSWIAPVRSAASRNTWTARDTPQAEESFYATLP